MSAAKAAPEAHRQARSKRDQARKEYSEKQELESLQQVFKRLDKNGDKKIDAEELGAALKFIGHKCKRSEVQEMIWEIDEDCDGCVSWDECRNAFERVKKDYDGWEPRRCIRERKRKPKRTRDQARQSSHSSQPPLTHTTRTRMRHRVVSLTLSEGQNWPVASTALCSAQVLQSGRVHDARQGSQRDDRPGRVHGDSLQAPFYLYSYTLVFAQTHPIVRKKKAYGRSIIRRRTQVSGMCRLVVSCTHVLIWSICAGALGRRPSRRRWQSL